MSVRNKLQSQAFTLPRLDFGQLVLTASIVLVSIVVVLVLHFGLNLSLAQSLLGGTLYLAGLCVIYMISRRARRVAAMRQEIADLRTQLDLMRLGRQQRREETEGAAPSAPLSASWDQTPEPPPPRTVEPRTRARRIEASAASASHDQSTLADQLSNALAKRSEGLAQQPGRPAETTDPTSEPRQHHDNRRRLDDRPSQGHDTAVNRGEPSSGRTEAHAAKVEPRQIPPLPASQGPEQARRDPLDPAAPDRPTAGASLDIDMMGNLIEQLAAKLNHTQGPPAVPTRNKSGPPAAPRSAERLVQASSAASDHAKTHRPATSAAPAAHSDAVATPATDERPAYDFSEPPHHRADSPDAHAADHSRGALETGTGAPYGKLALIADAVEANRIEVYLEPILGLSDRKARHFEFSLRLRTENGQELTTDQYAPVAAGTGLLSRIDTAKLQRAAEVAHRLRDRGNSSALFSTLSGESLADEYFLGSFADLLVAEEGIGTRLVLTFKQDEARTFAPAHWQAISAMARIGLKFALSDVTDLDMDFPALKRYGFEYVKLDAAVFLDGLPVPRGHVPAADICRYLSEEGFGLIVGGILAERDLAKIVGFGAVLGQGTLFGGPRSIVLDRNRRAA